MRRNAIRNGVAAAAGAATAAYGLLGISAPAGAATCGAVSGVSVVVDFGGSLRTGCAPGDPGTIWQAVQAAGFSLEGTQRFPTTFICRVDGFPAPADEACVNTPAATAYWALWLAGPGAAGWTYSSNGAATADPAPGSAIGLAFGAGGMPGQAPPPPPDSPSSTPPASTTTRPRSTSSSSSQSEVVTPPPAATTTPEVEITTRPADSGTAAGPASPTTRPTSSAAGTQSTGARATGDSSSPATAQAQAGATPTAASASQAQGSQGPPAAAIVAGGGGIAALMVVGALVVRRQRNRALSGGS